MHVVTFTLLASFFTVQAAIGNFSPLLPGCGRLCGGERKIAYNLALGLMQEAAECHDTGLAAASGPLLRRHALGHRKRNGAPAANRSELRAVKTRPRPSGEFQISSLRRNYKKSRKEKLDKAA